MKTHSSYHLPSLVPIIVAGNIFYFLRRYGIAMLAAAAFLVAIPLYAEAGSNIKQKDTGATVWENQDGEQLSVGDSGLTIFLEDVSTSSTAFVVTHRTGNVIKIYSVLHGEIANVDAVLDFGYAVSPQSGEYQAISSAGTTNDPQGGIITISFADGVTGTVDSVSFTVGTDPKLAVTQGTALWVHTDGGSTTNADATITIIIE